MTQLSTLKFDTRNNINYVLKKIKKNKKLSY